VDFYLPEIEVVVEADGPFGHLAKRDAYRDGKLKDMGIEDIWHFRENTLETIKGRLCLELNKLEASL
jgi:very-short-patch-repair endonuclease